MYTNGIGKMYKEIMEILITLEGAIIFTVWYVLVWSKYLWI